MNKLIFAVMMSLSSASALAQQCGVVKWYNHAKSFGFITPHDFHSDDIFFSISNIVSNDDRYMQEGTLVVYDKALRGPKGNIAIGVRIVNEFPAKCSQR